jgi:hypothetical protein
VIDAGGGFPKLCQAVSAITRVAPLGRCRIRRKSPFEAECGMGNPSRVPDLSFVDVHGLAPVATVGLPLRGRLEMHNSKPRRSLPKIATGASPWIVELPQSRITDPEGVAQRHALGQCLRRPLQVRGWSCDFFSVGFHPAFRGATVGLPPRGALMTFPPVTEDLLLKRIVS